MGTRTPTTIIITQSKPEGFDMPDRPNILVIETDSQDGRVLGCMGHPSMRGADGTSLTPNLDALAERGMLFRQTYSNNPICCPSRSSMVSGQYTHHCEGWNNYKGLEPDDETYFDRLAGAGYRTQIFGKTDWLSGHHTIRARVSPWTRSAWIMRPNYRMNPPHVEESNERRHHTRDWDDVERASAWLGDEGTSGDAPFMLYLGIRQPHPAFRTTRYWYDRVDPDTIEIPRLGSVDEHPALKYQRVNKNWMHGTDEDTIRLVRRIYFAQIAEVDDMVGTVLGALDEAGLRENTYVLFLSDHGEMAMEHGQFYKTSHFEPSARVPLIIAGPNVQPGSATDALTTLVDIHPTLMDIAGAPQSEKADGNSLLPELRGEPSTRPNYALSENHDSSLPTGSFMYRTDIDGVPWKLIQLVGCDPMLFNLADDPGELTNLASARPDILKVLDNGLRSVVDYEAVDAKVKAYDRASFRQWREQRQAAGDYGDLMSRVFSGWDDLEPGDIEEWTVAEEARIVRWMEGEEFGPVK